jgi:hypothetical protein
MKEKAPLGYPFIGIQEVAGQPMVVVGRPAHVAIAPLLCPKGLVIELKG